MQSAWLVGMGAGLGAAIVSAVGNVLVGDRHRISTMPDLVTGLAAVLMIGFSVRRAMRWHSEDKRSAGFRAAAGAAVSFGLATGAFAWWYLSNHPIAIAVAGSISNTVVALVIGLLNVRR